MKTRPRPASSERLQTRCMLQDDVNLFNTNCLMGHVRFIRDVQRSGCSRLIALLRDAFERDMPDPDGRGIADMKEFCRGGAVQTKLRQLQTVLVPSETLAALQL